MNPTFEIKTSSRRVTSDLFYMNSREMKKVIVVVVAVVMRRFSLRLVSLEIDGDLSSPRQKVPYISIERVYQSID